MFDRKLITVFSAPNYCGTDGNAASVMKVSRRLELSFITLKPRLDTSRLSEEKRLLLEKMLVDAMAKSPDPYSRLSTTGKNEKNESGHIDDSSLIGPPPVPGQVKPPAGKKDDCSTDMNDLENDKPPTNLVQQQPHPSYSYTPLVKEEFIKGVQYGTKDSALNNSSMIISPKKRDTTPSPPSYSTSPSKGSSPAPNVKAGSSKSTKPDMLKTNTNNTKDLSSSAATSKTVGPQTKACVKPISPHTKATPISPVTKVTAVPLHKPISPKIQSLSTRPNTKNSTESENSSSSSSTSLLGSVHQSRQPSKIPKPQSVAEATKNAMVSIRTPPQPHPKSPFEIINATEKALRSPRQA
ncbi:hypothetical protein DICVIV_09770 [Dictyocaulus viviparus]|uniref:Uncharacterized protein n=1 Tax=Dictyocaulus viviparus TaxID=29172 RepID=A0A0D8XHX5_DICVI|nr:hypothetical protein DICVIV_09770 [Dictyocaulus viviparus]